jgi:hypothetical protein
MSYYARIAQSFRAASRGFFAIRHELQRFEVLRMEWRPVRLWRSLHRRRFHRSGKQCAVEERIVQFQYFIVAQKDHD